MASSDPTSSVTAVDWPEVLQIASKTAETMGLSDRFTPLPGNYHEIELVESRYDMAIVANVTHIETPVGNRDLFRRLAKCLKPGGEIIVIDVLGGQNEGELSSALYALGLALRTENGKVYSQKELVQFLTDSGFKDCSYTPIPAVPYTMGMIMGRRPYQSS